MYRILKEKFYMTLIKLSILLLISTTILICCGCSTKPCLSQLNSLKPGITKSELIQKFGSPISTDYIDRHYLLKYSLYDQNDIGYRYYYFVFNDAGKLIGWQEYRGSNKIKVSGIIISLKP